MIKAIIIEDEAPARVTLKSYLRKYFPDVQVVLEIDNVNDAIHQLNTVPSDMVFVDVQLKDGKGIDVLNQVNSEKLRIVFTTAFDQYTLEAFKHKAFGYLMKPLDPLDFKEIVGRVIKDIKSDAQESKKLKILSAGREIWIDIKEIVRCQSESNYTRLYCVGGEEYTLSKTLKYVEGELINSSFFVRTHQSHLVNLNFIKGRLISKGNIELANGVLIPVSRSRKEAVIKAFQSI